MRSVLVGLAVSAAVLVLLVVAGAGPDRRAPEQPNNSVVADDPQTGFIVR